MKPEATSCSVRRGRRSREESGYVAVSTALLMVVLLLMAALAIDVSYFYARGNQLQRAADAGALAGVTRMPQLVQAQYDVQESGKRNRIVNDGSVLIQADAVPESPRRLKVTVTDSNVPTFFGKILFDHITIQRSATAEYVKRIPLGSAYNAIGTGNLSDANYIPGAPGVKQQFWLAINGPCAAKEEGDQIMSLYDGTASSIPLTAALATPLDAYQCDLAVPNSTRNTEYNPNGYDYIVNVPCSPSTTPVSQCPAGGYTPSPLSIQVYDPAFKPNIPPVAPRMDRIVLPPSPVLDQRYTAAAPNNVNLATRFRMYAPDNTPNDKTDDVLVPYANNEQCWGPDCANVSPVLSNANNCDTPALNGTDTWCNLVTIPAGSKPGRYRVNVSVLSPDAANPLIGNLSYGSNAFSLRATVGAVFTVCTTLLVGAWCPSTSGDESMGVFADAPTALSADFFLAQLSPAAEFRGKRIQVLLYDPGEGASSIQILPPGVAAVPTSFKYRTWFPGLVSPDRDDTSQPGSVGWPNPNSGTSVDVSGTTTNQLGLPQGLRRKNQFRYNGRKLILEINIPTNYGLDALGNETPLLQDGWWKIKYNFDPATSIRNDRTTWTVQLVGDPVHLVH